MANFINATGPLLRIALVGLGLGGLVLGAVALRRAREDVIEVPVESADEMLNRAGIPPIDAVAPERTETATFSLG